MKFDEGGHIIMRLRIHTGPGWDTTKVYCTCGWDKTYKSAEKADRKVARHKADHDKQEAA